MRIFGDVTQSLIECFAESAIYSVENLDIYADFFGSRTIDQSNFNVLILKEPNSVLPYQYSMKVLSQFDIIIPFGETRAKRLNLPNYLLNPYDVPQARTSPFTNRGIRFTMINSNRVSASRCSNYGLRRKLALKLSKENLDFKMYGTDWDKDWKWRVSKSFIALRDVVIAGQMPDLFETFSGILKTPNSFQSFVEDKFRILKDSEMSIVIENESDYVSEKVFDSLVAGAIPVYVGPDFPRELSFLEKLVIRAPHNANGILKVLQSISEKELHLKRLKLDEYSLYLDEWSSFNSRTVWSNALEIIQIRIDEAQ